MLGGLNDPALDATAEPKRNPFIDVLRRVRPGGLGIVLGSAITVTGASEARVWEGNCLDPSIEVAPGAVVPLAGQSLEVRGRPIGAPLTRAWSELAADDTSSSPKTDSWLVGGFNRTSQWVTGGLIVGLGSYLAFADTDEIRSLGDTTQFVPLLFATGVTIGVKDWKGLLELTLAGGTTFAMTHGIKLVVDKTRPNDSADNSFPSGHTAASVSGAAFLWRRYGPKWGAPASVLAIYTGISRVVGQNHFADDVVSGAAIGLISNWIWTHPIDERVRMSLFPTDRGAGVALTLDPSRPHTTPDWDEFSLPQWTFLWEIGGTDVVRNDVAIGSAGTIDFSFDQENNPTTTAFVSVVWVHPSMKYIAYGAFGPFEVRENFAVENDVVLPGGVIPAGASVQSRYIAYDYRGGAGYVALRHPRIKIAVGGSLAVLDTSVRLQTEDLTISDQSWIVRPLVSFRLDASLSKRWSLFSGLHWWSDSQVRLTDFTAQAAVRLHPKWALSLGYRWVDRIVESDAITNAVQRNQIALGVWYFW